MTTDVGIVRVQQRLINVPGVEGQSVAVTTLTDIRKEDNKVSLFVTTYCIDVSYHMGITWLSHGYHMAITWA